MRVAFIDNMNNNFFSFARYLRDIGVDADLYLTDSTRESTSNAHFCLESDTFADVSQFDFVYEFPVNYSWINLYKRDKLQLLKDTFKQYDILIACGFSAAFLYRAGVKIDIFLPYGSDLFQLAILENYTPKELVKNFLYKRLQAKGISSANIIIGNEKHPLIKRSVDILGKKLTNLGVPMVYNQEEYRSTYWDFLEEYDFIVFNHSRQIWKTCVALSDCEENGGNKRNDKCIRAFASFAQRHRELKSCLVLFEYGPDVDATKSLIEELQIADKIRWQKKMHRKEILAGLKMANFAVDQCRKNVMGIGGTSLESMSIGTPTITYTNGATEEKENFYFMAPFIDLLEEDQILSKFEEWFKDPEKFKKVGLDSGKWFDEKAGLGLAKRYVELCEKIMNEN